MSAKKWVWVVPGAYYYSTRYGRTNERVLHILKYWVPYVLLLVLLDVNVRYYAIDLVLAWLAFMTVYDVFCKENDEWAVRKEVHPHYRVWKIKVSRFAFLGTRVAGFICALAALGFVMDATVFPVLCLTLVAVVVLGAVHNRLPERLRPLTHALLYMAKGGLVMATVFPAMSTSVVDRYVVYTLLFNLTYSPSYVIRKVFARSRASLLPSRIGYVRGLLLQPVMLKNIVLVGLSIWDVRFLALLIWIDVMTLAEYALGRRIQKI